MQCVFVLLVDRVNGKLRRSRIRSPVREAFKNVTRRFRRLHPDGEIQQLRMGRHRGKPIVYVFWSSGLQDEHDDIAEEEDSWRLEHVEKFYARKVKEKQITLETALRKVGEISSLERTKKLPELRHVREHLRELV